MALDVHKIFKDLEVAAVGLDPDSDKMPEGFFVSFRSIGLPIHMEDFADPWSPFDAPDVDDPTPATAANPATLDVAAEGRRDLDDNKIAASDVAQSMKSFLNTFFLTDSQLQMNNNFQVMPNSSKVSDAWWAITTGATGVPLKTGLSPEVQALYDDARAVLMDENHKKTPEYVAYTQYREAYNKALRAYNTAYGRYKLDPALFVQWPQDGILYHDDVDFALNEWVSFGFKNEIESAMAKLNAQGTDPSIALIDRDRDRFLNSLAEFNLVGRVPYTMMSPSSWYDKDNGDGWTTYTKSNYEFESHYHASETSYGGGAGFNVGFFSIGGGFNSNEQSAQMNMGSNDLEISFSYSVVDINRPWLDSSLLNLGNWFLMGDYPKGCISDGTFHQQLPGNNALTYLPSIPTSLILVKDLSIRWSNWKTDWDSHEETHSATASVGWGPFAVSGHYSHHNEDRDFRANSEGESLQVPGIQLIGYVSMIHPLSPQHDSSEFMNGDPP